MLVQGDADHVLRRVLDQNSPLVVIAKLEELLAQIITKRVHHELDDVLVCLLPDHGDLARIAFLELLLKIAAAVLVLAQIVDLATERVQRHVVVARHGCKAVRVSISTSVGSGCRD